MYEYEIRNINKNSLMIILKVQLSKYVDTYTVIHFINLKCKAIIGDLIDLKIILKG